MTSGAQVNSSASFERIQVFRPAKSSPFALDDDFAMDVITCSEKYYDDVNEYR